MGQYTLYTYPNNKNSFKALITARYVGVQVDVPAFQMGKDNKTPEFLQKNPTGKVPTLDTPQGSVFESNAIARYLARLADKGLFGKTPIDMAHVEQWIDFFTTEVDPPLLSWVSPLFGFIPYDKKKEDAAIETIKKALKVLEGYLSSRTFLVGERVTLADIVGVANTFYGFTNVFDAQFREEFPCVTRWYQTCAHQPHFQAVLGKFELAKKRKTYDAEEIKKHQSQQQQQQQQPQQQQQKKPQQQQQPKKEAAPAADEDAKPAPKPKNPLDTLPPSKMILDSWKRLYSNTPASKFRDICIKGLWEGADIPNSPNNEHFEGYDPEGYCMFFCDFKYTDENTVNFIVMNKVGGFLQRIDYVRKYAFGVMCILKNEKGEFPIRGFWIFRGNDIPPIMKEECPDLDLYEWRRVDFKDEAQKKRLEDMLCEEEKIDGLEHVECKVFK
jgi:elongation factor 1-gamma